MVASVTLAGRANLRRKKLTFAPACSPAFEDQIQFDSANGGVMPIDEADASGAAANANTQRRVNEIPEVGRHILMSWLSDREEGSFRYGTRSHLYTKHCAIASAETAVLAAASTRPPLESYSYSAKRYSYSFPRRGWLVAYPLDDISPAPHAGNRYFVTADVFEYEYRPAG